MEKSDCRIVANIVTISWNETYKGIVSKDFLEGLYNNEEMRIQSLIDNFDDDCKHQFVLEVNGKVVGFINVGSCDNNEFNNYGEVYAIYLINEYKGNGYGRVLWNAGVKELKLMGFDKFVVGCLENNPTNDFYRHLGGRFIKKRFFEKLNLFENLYVFSDLEDNSVFNDNIGTIISEVNRGNIKKY